MTDFAKLIMTADTSGLKQGEAALDSIAVKGEQTEKRVTDAMDKTGKSATEAGDKLVELGKDAATAAVPLDALGRKTLPGVGAGAQKVIKPLKDIPGGIKDTTSAAKSLAPAVQNASYQVGDFAVQIASGGSATVALAQQMPQLLGGFGMFGALAGAAVAIGGAMIPMLMDLEGSAEANKKALDDLADAQDALNRSFSIATAPLGELIEKYGAAAVRVREMAIMQMQLNVAAAKSTLAETVAELSDATEKYTSVSGVFASHTGKALQAIADDFGVTGDAAWELIGKMKSLEEETNRSVQVEKFRELVAWLEKAGVAIEDMPPEMAKAAAAMLDVNISAEELQASIENAAAATGDATSATDDWASAVASVNAQLAGAYSLISAMGGGMVQRAGISAANTVLDAGGSAIEAEKARRRAEQRQDFINKASTAEGYMPSGMIDAQLAEMESQWAAQDEYDARLNAVRESEAAAKRKPRGGGRKSGGGRGKASPDEKWGDDVADYQRQTQAFLAQADAMAKVVAAGGDWERALAVLEEEQQLLNEAQRAGVKITPDVRAGIKEMAEAYVAAEEQLESLRQAQEEFAQAQEDIKNAFGNAFTDWISGASSFKDALSGIIAKLAEMAASRAFESVWAGMGGGGFGGMIAGALGFGGGVVGNDTLSQALRGTGASFDGGGYTGSGSRSGGLDGKGGFLAMMHPNETVIDHTKGQSAATSVHVTVGIDESGNLQVRNIAQQEAARAGKAVSDSIPGQIQKYNQHPRRR